MIHGPLREILVATRNPGKIREIQQALHLSPVKLRYLDEFSNVSPVDEVGRTYEENAVLKALQYSGATGVCAVADDSGLEVDALGGIPGVFSARFAGDHASDPTRINNLLAALAQHSNKERTARFVCCMTLVGWQLEEEKLNRSNPRLLKVTEGICEGVISQVPCGTKGFGFDPVFVPTGYDATFAELPDEVKATISHRAKPLDAMKTFLIDTLFKLDRWSGRT
jgi:XTP/dITP diphosphohydrolase